MLSGDNEEIFSSKLRALRVSAGGVDEDSALNVKKSASPLLISKISTAEFSALEVTYSISATPLAGADKDAVSPSPVNSKLNFMVAMRSPT